LLQKYGEVPLLINLTRGLNEEELRTRLNNEQKKVPNRVARELVAALIPMPLAIELCNLSQIDPESPINKQPAAKRDQLLKILCSTPLTVIGHHGWDEAMVTRGGISLKEVRPETLESRLIKGLYFCGEILNLDGPCGGFNLHWCFASGLLAGRSAAKE
ncbi:MAG: NAD(P)/FAD-dependent oxidoreductase, partial [Candidatus Riflebacteria bacterium]|nr:NAD(P)/FAD-dependent oxidoreductase [Candidatus Riflebacteria bacterium]